MSTEPRFSSSPSSSPSSSSSVAANTRLTLRAHPDDPDQRLVGLVWDGCLAARMEAPNDEAISGHRLHDLGLRDVRWLGEVFDSTLIADLEQRGVRR